MIVYFIDSWLLYRYYVFSTWINAQFAYYFNMLEPHRYPIYNSKDDIYITIWFFNTFKIIWVMQLALFPLFFRVLVDYLILNIWSRLCLKGQKVMMKILNRCVDKQKWSRQHQLYILKVFTELTTLVWST